MRLTTDNHAGLQSDVSAPVTCGKTHAALLEHIRRRLAATNNLSHRADDWAGLSDEQMLRSLFVSYRRVVLAYDEWLGIGLVNSFAANPWATTCGLQLTKFGLAMVRQFFAAGYEVPRPADEPLLPAHLLYLDRRAALPYYCGPTGMTIFDPRLTMLLRLTGGRISRLIEIDR